MRIYFDEQLSQLNTKLIEMGALCEEAIAVSVKALLDGDCVQASRVASIEQDIDHMEREIESVCLKLLLQQQPVARDLRIISAALKMITDMNRIGDQASDIAEIIPFLANKTGEECADIRIMAEGCINMVTNSIDAYVKRDIRLASNVISYDDVVDACFKRIKLELIRLIQENSVEGEYAIDLLMIAKYLERIGDHAVNIAQWVIFSVTGIHKGEE